MYKLVMQRNDNKYQLVLGHKGQKGVDGKLDGKSGVNADVIQME